MKDDVQYKLRDMLRELQMFRKEEQKLKAAELLDYWTEQTTKKEKVVRLVLPYVAALLRPGRAPSDAIPERALARAEYFERVIRSSERTSSDFRNQCLEKTAKYYSITKQSVDRDIKTAIDYYQSLGADTRGFARTSRTSD